MQRTVGRHRAPQPPRDPRGPVVAALLIVVIGAGITLIATNLDTPGATAVRGAAARDTTGLTTAPLPSNWPTDASDDPLTETPPATASPSPTGGASEAATAHAPGSGGGSAAPAQRATTRSARPTPAPSTPAATTPPRTSPSPTTGTVPEAGRVLALVNQARASCPAVTLNDSLSIAAQLHSEDQAKHNAMSHTGSDGSTFAERAERAGYHHAIAENVAYGYSTPEAVVAAWLNSPDHRANILDCEARAIGLGVAESADGTRYWTLIFGSEG